jgi:nitronate monooxygenase
MTLSTAFTELFGIRHPVALAPMGGPAGGALAAAVSEAGGLGLVGGGRGDLGWLDRELAIVRAGTTRSWGVGFLTWAAQPSVVEHALSFGPTAVMLSFGDPAALARLVRRAGVALILQVTDLAEARQALDLGADVIVAQGTAAGGHGGSPGLSTLTFVPVLADLAAPVPVLAAGGIADGRGLAAALVLGAAGALIGTRFLATPEALVDPAAVKAIIEGSGEQTERSTVLDIARGVPWPRRYPARALRHPFVSRWQGREDTLAADADARTAYADGIEAGDWPATPVWASEAIDLITDLRPAADLVTDLVEQAERALRPAPRR